MFFKETNYMQFAKKIGVFLLLLFVFQHVKAQILPTDTILHKKRLYAVAGIEGSLWAASIIGLNYVWYSGYDRAPWHTFNDNSEWLQMDKVGHATTSYFIGKIGYDMLRWSGVSRNKSIWYGGSLGFLYLTSIEMLDAYSKNWGFSWGDMIANASGAGLYMGQAALWKEQRISLKFSFHLTDYAQYRPNVLGSSFMERMLKDYNGQTYWLSGNIYSFLPKESRFPKWLNISLGYSGEGMLGGFTNPSEIGGATLPYFDRYRQYYLSVDVDWTRIPTRSKFLKSFFNIISFIKFPMPAIGFSEKATVFHPIYF